jgi:hypothetical protein
MAGTYPTTPEFQAINLESRHNNVMSETISGRMQVRTLGGQRWAFSARYNPMTRAEFQPVFAFVMSQQGQLGTFGIVPPVIGSTSGSATGTALCNGGASVGALSVPVDGFTGDIKAGDFVKFNHGKVYMVTADRDGAGNISIEPALVSAVADNEEMVYNSVTFTMRLNNDIQAYSLSANEYYEYEIDMIEVI